MDEQDLEPTELVRVRGRSLMEIGRYADARTAFLEVLARSEASATLLAEISQSWELEKKWPEAEQWSRDSLAAPGDLEFAHYQSARVHLRFARLAESLSEIQEAVRLDPQSARNLALLSKVLVLQGKSEEARKAAEEGLRIDPEHADCRLLKGSVDSLRLAPDYRLRGDLAGGLLEDLPDHPGSHHLRGWLRFPFDPKAAQEDFQRALALDPNFESARRGLLMTLRVQRTSGVAAEMVARKAWQDPLFSALLRGTLLLFLGFVLWGEGGRGDLTILHKVLMGLFVLLTWSTTVRVRGNLWLQFSPFRRYLTTTERFTGRCSGVLLLLMPLAFLALPWRAALMPTGFTLVALLPLSTVDLDPERPDRLGLTLTLALVGLGWSGALLANRGIFEAAWACWLSGILLLGVGFFHLAPKVAVAQLR